MQALFGGAGLLAIVIGIVTLNGLRFDWRVEYLRRQNIPDAEAIAHSYRFIGYSPMFKGLGYSAYRDEGYRWIVQYRFRTVSIGVSLVGLGLMLCVVAASFRVFG